MRGSELADALWVCMEARTEEKKARDEADVPDSWDYFGREYFAAIDRADARLAAVLDELLGRDLADPGSAPGEGPPADPVVSPADTIRDKAQQIIDKPQSPFGGSESGEEAWYWTHDWLAGFAQDVLALLAVGERDRAERERQQKRAERAEQVLREQVAANRTLVVAGERDRQQIAQLTEIVNAAESGARIPPVDCTNHCSDGPCDCSGEWRTVAWRIDVPALRAVLADEEDAPDA